MKILRIALHNINSLLGAQEVDFRKEPLASAGLYAIVGPTGAGKSTILDAVTLALYGKTERDRNGDEVMSHGTGECYVEVEYEVSSGRYLSRWERRRARQKPDGNLQTAQRVLSKWNDKGSEYQPVAGDKLREVNKKTEEVVGLDYERFVRSVMLTQGQFARFLLSSVDERADVLEKITGTEIYREISTAAFERHKLARQAYDRLSESRQHTLPLAAAERKELDEALAATAAETSHLRPRQKQVREELGLLRELATAEKRLAIAERMLTTARETWARAEPRRSALETSQRLQKCRQPLADQTRNHRQAQHEQQGLETDSTTLQAVETEAKKIGETLSERDNKLAAFLQAKPEKMETIRRAAILENELKTLTAASGKAENTARGISEKQRVIAAGIADLSARIKRASTGLTITEPDKLDSEIDRLTAERLALENWLKHRRLAVRRSGLLDQLKDKRALAEGLTERHRQAAENLESRRRLLARAQLGVGTEHLRAELKPGEACPVCGATEHPAASADPVTDADVVRARKDVEAAQKAEQETQKKEQNILAEIERLVGEAAALEREVAALPPATEISGNPTEDQLSELTDRIAALRIQRMAARELESLRPQLAIAQSEEKVVAETVATAEKERKQREATIKETREKLTDLVGTHSSEDCRKMVEAKEEKLRTQVATTRETATEVQRKLAATTQQLAGRKARVAELAAEDEQLSGQLTKLYESLDTTEAAARMALLEPDKETQERKEIEALNNELRTAQKHLGLQEEEVKKLKAATASLDDPEKLSATSENLEAQISTLDQRSGSLQKEIDQDESRRAASAQLMEKLDKAKIELNRWAALNELIGQQSGVKFSRFAQTLTLQRLVEVGNRHLIRISDRYQMRHRSVELSKENLELEIIDLHQNDNVRPMATLSGGETFLVSLALALGLSELASGRADIRSLFIDEGFGTLDDKVLDQAITALEQLEGQGKTIGLISHVKELRERIHCQIQLEPRGNGVSVIRVVS